MHFRAIYTLFLILLSNLLQAQDVVNFTQFFFNPYNINPSYAGIEGRPSVTLAYRKQWASIEGGPTIINFSFHAPATKRLALGLNVVQDKRGLLSNTGLLLSVGYNFPLADKSFLRFGISGGASFNKVDWEKLDGFTDNAISKILDNNTYLLGNAGMSLHIKSFHAGVSMPILFEPIYVSQDAFTMTEVKPFQAVVVHMSNRFYFAEDKYAFEPYLLYRINTGLPSQFEVAGVLHMNHIVYVGGSYKQDFGISALGGIKLKNTFAIGGSYSLKNTGINELNSPSYEVQLGFIFGAHKKDAQVYSFIDTQKPKEKKVIRKSASELIAEKRKQDERARMEALAKKQQQDAEQKKLQEAEQKKQQELAKQQSAQQAAKVAATAAVVAKPQETKTPPPSTKPEVKNETGQQVAKVAATTAVVAKTQETKTPPPVAPGNTPPGNAPPGTHRPRFDHVDSSNDLKAFEVTEHTPEDEKERISRLTLHAANPTETHNDPIHPNSERHEFVTRGSHKQELSSADYVVAGVFREESNATHFSNGLKKLGFKAGFGHLTEKSVWYVYVFRTNDINVAREERDKLRKTKILRDAWLLTVQQ